MLRAHEKAAHPHAPAAATTAEPSIDGAPRSGGGTSPEVVGAPAEEPASPPSPPRTNEIAQSSGAERARRLHAARHDKPAETRHAPHRTMSQSHSSAADPADGATLLTTIEAAHLLRVHPRTVQRLVERGQLSAVHLGGAV